MGKKDGGIGFDLQPSMAVTQTLTMIQQGFLELRMEAIKRKVLHSAAQTLYDTLMNKIPNSKSYASYKDSLRIVEAGQGDDTIFAVQAIPKESEEIEGDVDLIMLEPAKKRGKIDPAVQVLMQFQPWTLESLPMSPDPSKAKIVSKKTSRKMVEAVTKARKAQTREWTDALLREGIRIPPKKVDIAKDNTIKGMPDFVYQALSLEFGLGGVRGVAAWRPALVEVNTMVSSMFSKKDSAGFAEAMLDWQNTEWKKWKTLSAEKVSLADVATFLGFQDKIT